MGIAVCCLDLEHAFAEFEDGDIECAAAKVEDENSLVLILIQTVGERRRGGFVDDAQDFETCDLARVLRRLTLTVVEIRGHRNNRLRHRLTEICFGITLKLLQNHRRDLGRRVALSVDRNMIVRIAHMALNGRYRAVGVRNRLILCQTSDKTLTVLRKADHRRGDAAALRVRDNGRFAALHHRDNRVRRTKVNTNYFSHFIFLQIKYDDVISFLLAAGDLHHCGTYDASLCAVALLQHLRNRPVRDVRVLDAHNRLVHIRVKGLPLGLDMFQTVLVKHLFELGEDHLHALAERLAVRLLHRHRPLEIIEKRQEIPEHVLRNDRCQLFLLLCRASAEIFKICLKPQNAVIFLFELCFERVGGDFLRWNVLCLNLRFRSLSRFVRFGYFFHGRYLFRRRLLYRRFLFLQPVHLFYHFRRWIISVKFVFT